MKDEECKYGTYGIVFAILSLILEAVLEAGK